MVDHDRVHTYGPLRLFYDGACPLCRAHVGWLRKRDRAGWLIPEDIAAPGFDAARWGLDPPHVRRVLHALTVDGRVLRGMEAVRAIYGVVEKGWLLKPTGWPLLRPLFDYLYAALARNRVRWSTKWMQWRNTRSCAARVGICDRCAK